MLLLIVYVLCCKSGTNYKYPIWHASRPSFGQPWPLAQHFVQAESVLELDCPKFRFVLKSKTNDVLRDNVERYRSIICERFGISAYPWEHQERLLDSALGLRTGAQGQEVKISQSGVENAVLSQGNQRPGGGGNQEWVNGRPVPVPPPAGAQGDGGGQGAFPSEQSDFEESKPTSRILKEIEVVVLRHGRKYPHLNMDESCIISSTYII